jgi:formate-dependent nitrite reductase cytochrome c552 subunit
MSGMSGMSTRVGGVFIAAGLFAVGVGWAMRNSPKSTASQPIASLTEPSNSPDKFPITIRQPDGPPRINLGTVDATGKQLTAACSTCHATRPANSNNRTPADLDEFHQKLAFAHGKVSCLSCHNPEDYDTLHLADGRAVAYTDVMTLCAQCHGPQTRDYQHGAHGGMNGYWDLSKGPRTRNNCVDCHDPHSPSFPAMKPTFKPYDRFLSDEHHKEGHHE